MLFKQLCHRFPNVLLLIKKGNWMYSCLANFFFSPWHGDKGGKKEQKK